jgi:hypothetical protein
MERRDYLLRMLEDMGRIIARMRELLVGGDTAGAAVELQAAAKLAGLDLGTTRSLTAESLLMILRPTGDGDPTRVRLVAELLDGAAELARAEGKDDDAARYAAKADALRNNL